MAIMRACVRVDQNDVERLKLVTDHLKRVRHFVFCDHMPIFKAREVEFDPWPEAPIERNFIDGNGSLTTIHRRTKVIWRIQMSAVVA